MTTAPALDVRSNITGGPTDEVFRARVLGKYEVRYYRCRDTGYVQTEAPHWLAETYASPMCTSDTGVIRRNESNRRTVGPLLHFFFGAGAAYVDYGGGFGVYTRMMRDAGFEFYWDDRYTENRLARGFEYAACGKSPAALTAYEVFEHLVDPREELKSMLGLARSVVFSTELLPEPLPRPGDWWYYALEEGQHVSLYTLRALEALAAANGLVLASNGTNLHAFLEPGIVPLQVTAAWYRRWARQAPAAVRQAFELAYDFRPAAPAGRSLGKRLRARLDALRKRRGRYVRKPGLAPDLLAALAKSPLSAAFASHLLASQGEEWERVRSELHPKTEDDMRLLRARYGYAPPA